MLIAYADGLIKVLKVIQKDVEDKNQKLRTNS